jgi:hypothetical protein
MFGTILITGVMKIASAKTTLIIVLLPMGIVNGILAALLHASIRRCLKNPKASSGAFAP